MDEYSDYLQEMANYQESSKFAEMHLHRLLTDRCPKKIALLNRNMESSLMYSEPSSNYVAALHMTRETIYMSSQEKQFSRQKNAVKQTNKQTNKKKTPKHVNLQCKYWDSHGNTTLRKHLHLLNLTIDNLICKLCNMQFCIG